jgi:hypothetical protein
LRTDARRVRRLLDPDGPFLCDGSVPGQAVHPRGDRARWPVPLGLVQWDDAQGRLVALDESARKASRMARRYAGVVAESIHAADGLLRLRPRLVQPPPGAPDSEVDKVCAQHRLRDADFDAAAGRPVFHELVWVEGEADRRSAGPGRTNRAARRPGRRRRQAAVPAGRRQRVGAARGPRSAGGAGHPGRWQQPPDNRHAARRQGGLDPKLAVQSDGRVGIATDRPSATLHVAGTFHAEGATTVDGTLTGGGATRLSGDLSDLSVDGGCQFDGVVNVDNDVRARNFAYDSDRRLKKDIEPLTGALAKLLELRGTSFQWQDPRRARAGRSIGLIADEVEKVMPD